MSAAAEIRAKLSLCGRCKNCKIIVWGRKAELKKSATLIKDSEIGSYFTVRCNWLKTAVIEPIYLETCEGRQAFEEK